MQDDRGNYWFRAHSFGIGTAPRSWQGWLVTAIYAGAVTLVAHRLPGDAAKLAAIVALTAAFMALCLSKTDWRRGRDSKGAGPMIGFFANRAHLPWPIAIAAAALTIGIALVVSR